MNMLLFNSLVWYENLSFIKFIEIHRFHDVIYICVAFTVKWRIGKSEIMKMRESESVKMRESERVRV